jgi:uncharacterized membrane protein
LIMKKYIRCKVCGYVGEESEVENVCVACGASIKDFEGFDQGISEKRLASLALHIHPAIVHFPRSLAVLSFILVVIAFLTTGQFSANLITVVKVLAVILPFSIVAAMFSGMSDAKTRFQKNYGPLIKQKKLLGIIFLIVSVITAVMIGQEFIGFAGKVIIVFLSFVSLMCSAMLSMKGELLSDAIYYNKDEGREVEIQVI